MAARTTTKARGRPISRTAPAKTVARKHTVVRRPSSALAPGQRITGPMIMEQFNKLEGNYRTILEQMIPLSQVQLIVASCNVMSGRLTAIERHLGFGTGEQQGGETSGRQTGGARGQMAA